MQQIRRKKRGGGRHIQLVGAWLGLEHAWLGMENNTYRRCGLKLINSMAQGSSVSLYFTIISICTKEGAQDRGDGKTSAQTLLHICISLLPPYNLVPPLHHFLCVCVVLSVCIHGSTAVSCIIIASTLYNSFTNNSHNCKFTVILYNITLEFCFVVVWCVCGGGHKSN